MRSSSNTGRRAARATHGPRGAWSLLVAIPLDAAGLYLVLAALHLVPEAWPAAASAPWILVCAAVALFAAARAIALMTLRRLLRLRAASDGWSKVVSQRSR